MRRKKKFEPRELKRDEQNFADGAYKDFMAEAAKVTPAIFGGELAMVFQLGFTTACMLHHPDDKCREIFTNYIYKAFKQK